MALIGAGLLVWPLFSLLYLVFIRSVVGRILVASVAGMAFIIYITLISKLKYSSVRQEILKFGGRESHFFFEKKPPDSLQFCLPMSTSQS